MKDAKGNIVGPFRLIVALNANADISSLDLRLTPAPLNQSFNRRMALSGMNPSLVYYPRWAASNPTGILSLREVTMAQRGFMGIGRTNGSGVPLIVPGDEGGTLTGSNLAQAPTSSGQANLRTAGENPKREPWNEDNFEGPATVDSNTGPRGTEVIKQ